MFRVNIPWRLDDYFFHAWFDFSEFTWREWMPGELDSGSETPSGSTDHFALSYVRYCFFGLILVFGHGYRSEKAVIAKNRKWMAK